ncbi:unnamed protein product [Protopolystoma xenopodis]|uniref:Uncharacterized protein n=1 Tax=Protopolystoma xenopodis TaxID=117903 RepID=A0A448WPI2_9PLAT|nr:unnamed protein product [Protopolystoma xenopodis]
MAQKKARLEAIRQERRLREEQKRTYKDHNTAGIENAAPISDLRSETEEMLKTLGLSSSPQTEAAIEQIHDLKKNTLENRKWLHSHNRNKKLQVARVYETSIPPHDNVSYSKETQTIEEISGNDCECNLPIGLATYLALGQRTSMVSNLLKI